MAYTPTPRQSDTNSRLNINAPVEKGYNIDFVAMGINCLFAATGTLIYFSSAMINTAEEGDSNKIAAGCSLLVLSMVSFIAGVTASTVHNSNRVEKALTDQMLKFTLHSNQKQGNAENFSPSSSNV